MEQTIGFFDIGPGGWNVGRMGRAMMDDGPVTDERRNLFDEAADGG